MPAWCGSTKGFRSFLANHTAAQHQLCLQAHPMSWVAPTSHNWRQTCSGSGTTRPTPTWAASPLLPRVGGRSGGAAACAGLGSRTDGWRESGIATQAAEAPTMLAKQCAPAMTWPTTIQRWQTNGTGRPMGNGHQRLLLQAPPKSKQPGGVTSVGTDGAHVCRKEHKGKDAPSVPVRHAAIGQNSPASVMDPRICWLSGTGKPTRNAACTQTRSLWDTTGRCTGSCKTSASWAWCTDGRPHQMIALQRVLAPPSNLAMLCVPATPWLCNAQRQPQCGTTRPMEPGPLKISVCGLLRLCSGERHMAGTGSRVVMNLSPLLEGIK